MHFHIKSVWNAFEIMTFKSVLTLYIAIVIVIKKYIFSIATVILNS